MHFLYRLQFSVYAFFPFIFILRTDELQINYQKLSVSIVLLLLLLFLLFYYYFYYCYCFIIIIIFTIFIIVICWYCFCYIIIVIFLFLLSLFHCSNDAIYVRLCSFVLFLYHSNLCVYTYNVRRRRSLESNHTCIVQLWRLWVITDVYTIRYGVPAIYTHTFSGVKFYSSKIGHCARHQLCNRPFARFYLV